MNTMNVVYIFLKSEHKMQVTHVKKKRKKEKNRIHLE